MCPDVDYIILEVPGQCPKTRPRAFEGPDLPSPPVDALKSLEEETSLCKRKIT